MRNTFILIMAITIAGLLIGWGVSVSGWSHYKYSFLPFLDGIQMISGLVVAWMVAKKYKEAYIVAIFTTLVLIVMFSFIGQITSLISIFWYMAVNVYALISWSHHYKESQGRKKYILNNQKVL
jgi:nicotinamide riboside transporter PnuC